MQLTDLAATSRLATKLAAMLRPGDCLALSGDLGAGKTTFARAVLQALDPSLAQVPSPTFGLLQIYELPNGEVWHADLYRLQRSAELLELGWQELDMVRSLVEWPERADGWLPTNTLRLNFVINAAGERFVTLAPQGNWQTRLAAL